MISKISSVLEDCRILADSISDKHRFKANKSLIEQKFKYNFKAVEEKEVAREFYSNFVIQNIFNDNNRQKHF